MTVDEMIAQKKECGYSYEYIAEKSGVPASTVQKVLSKKTSAPRYATLTALTKVFQSKPLDDPQTDDWQEKESGKGESGAYPSGEKMEEKGFVCENENSYDTSIQRMSEHTMIDGTSALDNGTVTGRSALDSMTFTGKTIQDYLNLPEGVRVELIDGEFYDLAAPTPLHQRLSFLLGTAFELYIDANHGECMQFVAPLDVQLDCDEKTMVQPDVLVVCDRNKITKERLFGAPDVAVEILSPSTWYHDTVRKLLKYKKAGVREYWIVMPRQQKVLVYAFEKSDRPLEYTFADKVPVAIWEGKCRVDFQKIYEKVRFWL